MRPTCRTFALLGLVFLKGALGYLVQAVVPSTAPPLRSPTHTNQWDLTAGPPINSASNYIFSSVSSFLQHWPNTRYRNGHNIVPGIIPVGTVIYHGTDRNEIPNHPEWAATDPEHSYVFCRSLEADSGCWHLTLVATRPLKVLYFDGSSAAKMDDGPMDSQDLVAWGEIRAEWAGRDGDRIIDLCEWGKKYEIDAFLRMEMDFEIMLCDFFNGVQPVSFLNLVAADQSVRKPVPRHFPSGSPPPSRISGLKNINTSQSDGQKILQGEDQRRKFPLRIPPLFHLLEAGSWHNHFPGDPRIQLDYSRMISFYDPTFFPSLHYARLGQGRLEHRLKMISPADVNALMGQLDAALRDWHGASAGSGVDWRALSKVISNRYAERLELLHYILNSTSTLAVSRKDANVTLREAYRHTASMVAPYILRSAVPSDRQDKNLAWASSVYEVCATTHTDYIENSPLSSKLTHSEHVLLGAVRGVTTEICRVLVGLWAEGTEAGLAEPDLTMLIGTGGPSAQEVIDDWKIRVENLIAWLDWSDHWMKCRPACSYEEMCYLPTWPWFANPKLKLNLFRHWLQKPARANIIVEDDFNAFEQNVLGQGEWVDPQPRCIRRLEPLEFKD